MISLSKHLPRARRAALASCWLATALLLAAWARSCFVAEEFYTQRVYVSWPGGLEMDVRVGSPMPGQWLLEGQPCVEHYLGRSISSGYGRFTLWFNREDSTRPRTTSLGDEPPLVPPPTPKDHEYTSSRIDPWSLFRARESGPLSNEVTHLHFLGSSVRRGFSKTLFETSEEWQITIPYWLPTILFCVPIARQLRRRKPTPGHCPNCNYDLRASKNRCPECGNPVPQP